VFSVSAFAFRKRVSVADATVGITFSVFIRSKLTSTGTNVVNFI
jgi:hypothetical protein